MQTLNGKVWQDAIESQMKQSVETKREFVQDKVRARLEKEVNEQQIAIEDYRLKYDISQQEITVLKQTLDWVQERLDFYQKRWR